MWCAAAPSWCTTVEVDENISICLPAAADPTILRQAWGDGIAGFRDTAAFIERNCDAPTSWVGDNYM
jgi:hypothetical protein